MGTSGKRGHPGKGRESEMGGIADGWRYRHCASASVVHKGASMRM